MKRLFEAGAERAVDDLLNPDDHADAEWASGVEQLAACREALKTYNHAALGHSPAGFHHYIHWIVLANGNKVQFEEPSRADQWLVSVVCPPPHDWRKARQRAWGTYVPAAKVPWLAKELRREAAVDKIEPKKLLYDLIARAEL